MLVDSAAKLIYEEALLVSLEIFHDLFASLRVTIEIASDIMAIEVVAFEVEGRRKFSAFIQLIAAEDFATFLLFQDVTSLRVDQVTLLINTLATLVNKFSLLVLEDQRMTSFITIEVTKDVIHVEPTLFRISHIGKSLILLRI
jgi:hypothetical protein